jgi:hypothetical protein
VAPHFPPALDVPNAGVLCALPALLAIGLLDGVERHLQLPKGYYGLDSLLLLLAFMALARLSSIEALRYARRGNGAICWGSIGYRKCAPCAQRSNCWPRQPARRMERGTV